MGRCRCWRGERMACHHEPASVDGMAALVWWRAAGLAGGLGLVYRSGLGAGRRTGRAPGGGRIQGQSDEGGAGGQGDGAAHDHQDGPQRQPGRWQRRRRGRRAGRRFGWRGGGRGGRGCGGQRQQQRAEDGQCPAGRRQEPPGVAGTGTGVRAWGLVGHVRSLLACCGPGGLGAAGPPIRPAGSTPRGGRNAIGRGVEAGLESAWTGGGIGGEPAAGGEVRGRDLGGA
jgi:hypothetical protein